MKKIVYLAFALFCVANLSAQITKIYDFQGTATSGKEPSGSIITDGTYLYSTTSYGGEYNKGLVFRIKPDGTDHQVLHSFDGSVGELPTTDLLLVGEYLFGTTTLGGVDILGDPSNSGIIYKIQKDGTNFVKLNDFKLSAPIDIELVTDGLFIYGASYGGNGVDESGWGFLFKMDLDGSNYSIFKLFSPAAEGRFPDGKLVLLDSKIYGYTVLGGSEGNGVIYSINTDVTGFTVLFNNLENGISAMISDGTYLYGYSLNGGTSYPGLIFKIKKDGTEYSIIKELDELGSDPSGYLTIINNKLFGQAYVGPDGNGGIYSLNTDGTGFNILYECNSSFVDLNGERPVGKPIFINNELYTLMQLGGSYGNGTIVKYSFPTKISELNYDKTLTIFPNPAQYDIQIDNLADCEFVEVYNIAGQLVYSANLVDESTIKIDVSSFANGSYIVKIKDKYNNLSELDFVKI